MKECTNCETMLDEACFWKYKGGLKSMCETCAKKALSHQRMRNKLHAIRQYSDGSMTCSCCNESKIEFLAVDHVNGGGNKHRHSMKENFHLWLKKNKYPNGYRVLCHNCNSSYGSYGYCPHSSESKFLNFDENQRFGKPRFGESMVKSKLTDDCVRRIKEMIRVGNADSQISKFFPVSSATIRNIRIGKIWKHIQ